MNDDPVLLLLRHLLSPAGQYSDTLPDACLISVAELPEKEQPDSRHHIARSPVHCSVLRSGDRRLCIVSIIINVSRCVF